MRRIEVPQYVAAPEPEPTRRSLFDDIADDERALAYPWDRWSDYLHPARVLLATFSGLIAAALGAPLTDHTALPYVEGMKIEFDKANERETRRYDETPRRPRRR